MSNETNDQLILIAGLPATGKSASLRSIRNQDRWVYNNTESGKRLPFRNNFIQNRITDPWEIHQMFDDAMENADHVDGAIIDSITFLMEMFDSQYIYQSEDSRSGWQDYAQFWKSLMQQKVVQFGKPVIMTAHLQESLNTSTGRYTYSVPVKGSLKNNGLEAFFSTIVTCKKVTIKDLEKVSNGLLEITDEERELGYKHVFQTRPTKETIGEPIRGPLGLFSKEETFIDNDAQKLLDHVAAYYG